jgi:hypothetical protein
VKQFKLYRLTERIYMIFPSVVDMATDIKSMQWDSLVSGKKLVRIRDALKNLVLKKRFLLQMSKTPIPRKKSHIILPRAGMRRHRIDDVATHFEEARPVCRRIHGMPNYCIRHSTLSLDPHPS